MDGWCVCVCVYYRVCVKLFNLFWGNFVSISLIMNVWFYLFFFSSVLSIHNRYAYAFVFAFQCCKERVREKEIHFTNLVTMI